MSGATGLLLVSGQALAQQCQPTGTNQNCTNSISLSGSNGISDTATATIINTVTGTITGIGSGILAATTNATNYGTISASGSGSIGVYAISGDANVTNFETISGVSAGIRFFNNAIINNSGTISGGDHAVEGNNSVPPLGTSIAIINNSGVMSGNQAIFVAGNASVINSGSITGDARAISANFSAIVANTGVISAANGYGIFANQMSVNNSGVIYGGLFAVAGGEATVSNSGTITGGVLGVDLNTVSLTNSGSISGNIGIRANGSVTNSGTIAGIGGTAIQFTGVGNTLTLGPGSIINGNVIGSGTDTFQLGGIGGSTFDLNMIGTQYTGFTAFNVVSGIWTVSNTFGQSQPWNVNGGTLAGTGTIASVNVNAGATLAPGKPGVLGTFMTIGGNLVFHPGATYAVSLNPSSSTYAVVGGTATLAGTVNASFAPGGSVAHQLDILRSGGLGGTTFAGLTTNNPNFTTSLGYTATDVLLNLTAATLGNGTGVSRNQQNVAGAINGFFNNGGTLPPGFGTLFGLTGGSLSSALSQVSGEAATGSQQTTFNAMGQFMGLLADPFMGRGRGVNAPSGAPAFAAENVQASAYAASKRAASERDAYAIFTKAPLASSYDARWSVWAAGYGGSQTTDGNPALGSNNTTSSIYGIAAGADYRLSPQTIAGFALAGGGTNFNVANNLGSGRSDLFQAGAFIRHTAGAAYISGALAYGWQDITTNRTVTVAGFDQLRAQFNANAFSGRLEGGYRFVTPWIGGIGITPYAAGQFTTFDLPAYAEQAVVGSNAFALAYGSRSVTDMRSELGLRTDKSFAMPDGIVTLRGRIAWAHDFSPDRNIGATFQTLPGMSFAVNGAAQAPEAALVTASAEKKWLTGWSAAATFEGEFSQVTTSYAGKGVVRYSW